MGKQTHKDHISASQANVEKQQPLESTPEKLDKGAQRRGESQRKEKATRGITLKDAKEFGSLISNIQTGTSELEHSVDQFVELQRELNTENGMSILDAKKKLITSYIVNLLFYISRKVEGKSVSGHPVISRLLYLKTMLQKLRPLQQKTAYQIQKAIQTSALQSSSQKTGFKPRPSQFDLEDGENDEEKEEDEYSQSQDEESAVPKYKAPLLNQTLTNKELAKERRKKAASRKNIARSALMQEIREEMLDLPEEIFDQEDKGKRLLDEEKEIQDFQAQHFKRVSLTKQHKQQIEKKRKEMKQQQRALQDFDSLGLGDITAALNQTNEEEQELVQQKNLAQFLRNNKGSLKQRKMKLMDEEITSSEEEGQVENKRERFKKEKGGKKKGGIKRR